MLIIIFLLLVFLIEKTVVRYLTDRKTYDIPNDRSCHQVATLRGGGLIFILVFYVIFSLIFIKNKHVFSDFQFLLILSSLAVFLLGYIEDSIGLSIKARMIIEISICMFVLIVCYFTNIVDFSLLFMIPIALFWVLTLNLYNFMDGADGYAVQQAIFMLISLCLINSTLVPICLAMIVSLLFFLRNNFPPATIFMGDVGSLFLGFLLFGLFFEQYVGGYISIDELIIMSSLFSFDAIYTIVSRFIQGKNIFQAHREHWYQRYLLLGFSHRRLFMLACIYNSIIFLGIWIKHNYNINLLLLAVLLSGVWWSYIVFNERKEILLAK